MRSPTLGSIDIHDIRTLTATGPIDVPGATGSARSSDRDQVDEGSTDS